MSSNGLIGHEFIDKKQERIAGKLRTILGRSAIASIDKILPAVHFKFNCDLYARCAVLNGYYIYRRNVTVERDLTRNGVVKSASVKKSKKNVFLVHNFKTTLHTTPLSTMSLKREGTMANAAAEGEKFLEKLGGSPKGRTRAEEKEAEESSQEAQENGDNKKAESKKRKAPASPTKDKKGAKKPKLDRAGTMDNTAAEGEKFLSRQGGTPKKAGKTRSGITPNSRMTRSMQSKTAAANDAQKLLSALEKKVNIIGDRSFDF